MATLALDEEVTEDFVGADEAAAREGLEESCDWLGVVDDVEPLVDVEVRQDLHHVEHKDVPHSVINVGQHEEGSIRVLADGVTLQVLTLDVHVKLLFIPPLDLIHGGEIVKVNHEMLVCNLTEKYRHVRFVDNLNGHHYHFLCRNVESLSQIVKHPAVRLEMGIDLQVMVVLCDGFLLIIANDHFFAETALKVLHDLKLIIVYFLVIIYLLIYFC